LLFSQEILKLYCSLSNSWPHLAAAFEECNWIYFAS